MRLARQPARPRQAPIVGRPATRDLAQQRPRLHDAQLDAGAAGEKILGAETQACIADMQAVAGIRRRAHQAAAARGRQERHEAQPARGVQAVLSRRQRAGQQQRKPVPLSIRPQAEPRDQAHLAERPAALRHVGVYVCAGGLEPDAVERDGSRNVEVPPQPQRPEEPKARERARALERRLCCAGRDGERAHIESQRQRVAAGRGGLASPQAEQRSRLERDRTVAIFDDVLRARRGRAAQHAERAERAAQSGSSRCGSGAAAQPCTERVTATLPHESTLKR
jgi:hypothetical protein